MVSTISSNSLAQSMLARVESRKAQAAAPETAAVPAASADDAGKGATTVASAQLATTARVGGQLDAQFDAGRAQEEAQAAQAAQAAPAAEADAAAVDGAADGAEAVTDAGAATGESAAAAPATAGGAHMGGGASAASSSGASATTDYIAEADTNQDRKLSEQERIAYAKKQASEAETAAAGRDPAQRSRAQEVQQAYLPQETAGRQLDISA